MTDKELIRTEIERRKEICKINIANASGANLPYVMEMTAYDKILTFIESLPEHSKLSCVERIGKDCKEDPLSDDFKKFEENYLEREKEEILCVYDRHAGLVDGAQWQKGKDDELLTIAYMDGVEKGKKQMMKDAVECTICASYENPYGGYTQLVDSKTPLLTFGGKVKLIIIKNE